MANKMEWYDNLAILLLIVGGINWGLFGVFGFDIVAWASMGKAIAAKIVYGLVGLAGVYGAWWFKDKVF